MLLIAVLVASGAGCAKKDNKVEFHLKIIDGGISSRVMGEKTIEKWNKQLPVKVTVTLDGKVLAKDSLITSEKPLEINTKIKPGEYSLRFGESSGQASKQTMISLRRPLWTRAMFFREGPKLGYFRIKSHVVPFDSEEWNKGSDATGDVLQGDDVDRRFEKLKEDIDKKKNEKKK